MGVNDLAMVVEQKLILSFVRIEGGKIQIQQISPPPLQIL